MAGSWPEYEISPIDELPLLQSVRLRPFGINYLQGAISPELGLIAHPDGSKVLLLQAFVPDGSTRDNEPPPPLGTCVATIDVPTRPPKHNTTQMEIQPHGKQDPLPRSEKKKHSAVRSVAWTRHNCRSSSQQDSKSRRTGTALPSTRQGDSRRGYDGAAPARASTRGDLKRDYSDGENGAVAANALRESQAEEGEEEMGAPTAVTAISRYLAVAWEGSNEVRLWQVTRRRETGTYQTVEVLTGWDVSTEEVDLAASATVDDRSGDGRVESDIGGDRQSGGNVHSNDEDVLHSGHAEERTSIAVMRKKAVAFPPQKKNEAVDTRGGGAANSCATSGSGKVHCLAFRPLRGTKGGREQQSGEVPLAAWHSGGVTLFGKASYATARNQTTFSAPVPRKKTCGSWSGCGRRLALSSGGEIRIFRSSSRSTFTTGHAKYATTDGKDHGGVMGAQGDCVKDQTRHAKGYVAHQGAEFCDGNGVGRGATLDCVEADRGNENPEIDGSAGMAPIAVNMQASVLGAEFRTALRVDGLRTRRLGGGGVSGFSSPGSSSPSPPTTPRSPLAAESSSMLSKHHQLHPGLLSSLHDIETTNANPLTTTAVRREEDGVKPSSREVGTPLRASGQCTSGFLLRNGSGGASGLSSRSSISRSRGYSLVVGDLRAMCPGGKHSFFGTTDGGLGLGLGLGSLQLSDGAAGSSSRCLNDSFFANDKSSKKVSIRARGTGNSRSVRIGAEHASPTAGPDATNFTGNRKELATVVAAAEGEMEEISVGSTVRPAAAGSDSSSSSAPDSLSATLPLPPPPVTSGRRGGFRNVLPGENWQAGPMRPRTKAKGFVDELSGQTKLQPHRPSGSGGASAIACSNDMAEVAATTSETAALAAAVGGGMISKNSSGSAAMGTSSTVDGSTSKFRSSPLPSSTNDGCVTERAEDPATAAVLLSTTSCSSSSRSPRISPGVSSAESTSTSGPSPATRPSSPEVIDLRGKLGGAGSSNSTAPALHPLLRLPLGGDEITASNGDWGAATDSVASSPSPASSVLGAADLSDNVGKRNSVRGNVVGSPDRRSMYDSEGSIRQPCLMLVMANSLDGVDRNWEARGEGGGGGVEVKTIACLPPALSSPDLVAASEDGTLVCVGSHACGLVACYRIAPSPPRPSFAKLSTSPIAPPTASLSSVATGFARKDKVVMNSAAAERSGAVLVEGGKNNKISERARTSSESPSYRNDAPAVGGQEPFSAVGNNGRGKTGASRVTGCHSAGAGGRQREKQPARPVCTLRLPPGLRAKGLAFAVDNSQRHSQERRRRRRRRDQEQHGYERCHDKFDVADLHVAGGQEGGEEAKKCQGITSAQSVDDGLVREGVEVLVLAAAPAAAAASSAGTFVSKHRKSSLGSSIEGVYQATTSDIGAGGGGSIAGDAGAFPPSSSALCCRTVLLRFLLPAIVSSMDCHAGAGQHGAGFSPQRALADGSPALFPAAAGTVKPLSCEGDRDETTSVSRKSRSNDNDSISSRSNDNGDGVPLSCKDGTGAHWQPLSSGRAGSHYPVGEDVQMFPRDKVDNDVPDGGPAAEVQGVNIAIMRALEGLEERVNARFSGLEKALCDVSERVGVLERVVAVGTTTVDKRDHR